MRDVTEAGKATIRNSFEFHGRDPSQPFLVRMLRAEEEHVNPGTEEYEVVDGNHRVAVLREGNYSGDWDCIVLKPDTPREGAQFIQQQYLYILTNF